MSKNTIRLYRPARRNCLPPDRHAELVAAIGRQLDSVEARLEHLETAVRRHKHLMRTRDTLLRKLVNAEDDHFNMSHPVAWAPSVNGPGVVVVTKGGWTTLWPDHTPEQMRALGIEEMPW